jgi:tungstate transport system substrate-binding protein
MRRKAALFLIILIAADCSGESKRVIVAAATTLVDSGIIDRVVEIYEEENPGVEISVVGNPTRLTLALGRQKSADLLITHAPAQEAEFIESGAAAAFAPVLTSRFIVAGPETWRETATGLEAPEVFRILAEEGQTFVSRGDGSGTHDLELLIWLEAGIDPSREAWYMETGQGMRETLLIADQREAVILAERGAFLSARSTLDLVDLQVDAGGLDNPYTGIVVAGTDGTAAAEDFLDWLTSSEGLAAIEAANIELFGELVYEPPGDSG